MASRAVIACVFLCFLILSGCSDDSGTSSNPTLVRTITVTDEPHHLGDNPGSEGTEYNSSFDVGTSFTSAKCSISFLYPNSSDVSGPEIDSPPEIYINDQMIGMLATDFPDQPGCISAYREYECDVTIRIGDGGTVISGTNTIRIVAMGAAHQGDDDFVFTDLKVLLYR